MTESCGFAHNVLTKFIAQFAQAKSLIRTRLCENQRVQTDRCSLELASSTLRVRLSITSIDCVIPKTKNPALARGFWSVIHLFRLNCSRQ